MAISHEQAVDTIFALCNAEFDRKTVSAVLVQNGGHMENTVEKLLSSKKRSTTTTFSSNSNLPLDRLPDDFLRPPSWFRLNSASRVAPRAPTTQELLDEEVAAELQRVELIADSRARDSHGRSHGSAHSSSSKNRVATAEEIAAAAQGRSVSSVAIKEKKRMEKIEKERAKIEEANKKKAEKQREIDAAQQKKLRDLEEKQRKSRRDIDDL